MSTRRGDCQRKRAQNHQNKTVFKNDLHDKSDRTKALNAMSINEVCTRCHDTIQWKIKYRKYKALSAPGGCNICLERKVKKAYHVICRDCAIKNKQCAKCLKKDSEVEIIPAGPTPEEQLREKVETMAMIKSLPERKRRTILRQRRKKKPVEGEEGEDDGQEGVEMENGLAKKKTASQSDDEFYDGISEGDDENDDDEWASDDFSSGEEEPKNKI